MRLDRVLTNEIPGYSRSQIQRLIDEGLVALPRVKTVKANTAVREGDVISVQLPAPAAAKADAEELPLDVLYQDSDMIVVNKPAGMVVHPGAGHEAGTLVNALLHHVSDLSGIGGELRPGIVHRLDKGTSGVMVVAKNDAAHQELSRQFHDREVEKTYVALVWGLVQQRKRIDLPIGRDPVHREKISTRARRARSAVTRVTLGSSGAGIVAVACGDFHRTDASDPRASEPHRPSHCRRFALRRRAPPGRAPAARGAAADAAVSSLGAPRDPAAAHGRAR